MDFQERLTKEYNENDTFAEDYELFLREEAEVSLDGLPFKSIKNKRHNSDQIVIFSYNGKYYRIIGHYDSWNGTDFLDPCKVTEVAPEEQTIIVYNPVKKG